LKQAFPKPNALISESSPYLRQHAMNPVNWLPWGDEALDRSLKEDKLMIISIGYSACHWCHVMEHESFNDPLVAEWMNREFVCVKVDREERPDVDAVYMDAVQLISGRGGWPLNAFALPGGQPLHAGTYYPKENWLRLLEYLSQYWKNERDAATERAQQLSRGIQLMDVIEPADPKPWLPEDQEKVHQHYLEITDREWGGRIGAPKFPMPVALRHLMLCGFMHHREDLLQLAELSLTKMAIGGIYDHVGGGFARYSTDERWEIPHFEKMLYDNAQLLGLYAAAWRMSRNDLYRRIVVSMIDFLNTELKSEDALYCAALDADSEGEEGRYYVFTNQEIDDILESDAIWFKTNYELEPQGNFEGHHHLWLKQKPAVLAAKAGCSEAEWVQRQQSCLHRLKEWRSRRVKPGLDDKLLCSWNAMLASGLIEAGIVFDRNDWILSAEQILNTLLSESERFKEAPVRRDFKAGNRRISGFLEDYAMLIQACIEMYEANLDMRMLQKAEQLCEFVLQHFLNPVNQFFFFTAKEDQRLIARKTEVSDNVIPSSNAIMAMNLLKLGKLLGKASYEKQAAAMFEAIKPQLLRFPSFFAAWGRLADWISGHVPELVVCGPEARQWIRILQMRYPGEALWTACSEPSDLPLHHNRFQPGRTLIYICKHNTCGLPYDDPETALAALIGEV
jgi:uncharacterized protein YyaL (SSP411 family)